MHRVTPIIRDAFGPAEQALQESFIPALIQGLGEGTPGRGATYLPVKQVGLALPDPTNKSPENWKASYFITGHLITALRGKKKFWTSDHSACLQEGRATVQKRIVLLEEEALEKTLDQTEP